MENTKLRDCLKISPASKLIQKRKPNKPTKVELAKQERQARCKLADSIEPRYFASLIDAQEADAAYNILKKSVPWHRTYGGHRVGKSFRLGDNATVDKLVKKALAHAHINVPEGNVRYIFANYYADGSNFCNPHAHAGTHQVIVSLGAPRELFVGKNKWLMQSGDVVSFGSQLHGVTKAKSSESCGGRISLAVFANPCV